MSGVKRSRVDIQQQRQEQLRRVQAVTRLHGEAQGLCAQLQQTLNQATPGLKDTFRLEVAEAESFLARVQMPAVTEFTVDHSASDLERARGELSRLAGQATELHKRLATAFGEKADRLGRELTDRFCEAERLLAGHSELLKLWEAPEQMRAWQAELQQARQQLADRHYSQLGPALERLVTTIRERAGQADQREELHQKRLYVLRAINKVCKARGFERVEDPTLRDKQDRGSPITMLFDTMAKGRIEFTLTLDGIHTESEIAGGACWQDFDALSQSLADMFGIETHFVHPDGTRPEDIEAKGVGSGAQSVTKTRTASPAKRG